MPYWGLVVTSLSFFIPSLLAFKNKNKKLGFECSALTITSILYHGTQNIILRQIDMTYVYCLASFYIGKSIWNLIKYKRQYDLYIHIGSLGCVYLYFSKCDNPSVSKVIQKRYHMIFHIAAQYLFSLHALDRI